MEMVFSTNLVVLPVLRVDALTYQEFQAFHGFQKVAYMVAASV
jgi:hypothetical protein